MSIKIKKHWEDLETFDVDVMDKRGDVFMYEGKPWVMVLRPPESDKVKEVVRKNAAEAAGWRDRQPAGKRDDPLPDAMSERHTHRIIQASHVSWKNAPLEEETTVDFEGDDFVEFLKENIWYVSQWMNAWSNRKNSTRLITADQPKKTSSTGAKAK